MQIDRLSGEDQVMLAASCTWPQDIGALALLDGRALFDSSGRFRAKAVRDLIASRLYLVPRLRQRLLVPGRGLGDPLWVDDRRFDLNDHVRIVALPSPAGEAELLLTTERLRLQGLDPARSLWEMWLLTGLPERRVGLFVKLHHSVADGRAALTILGAFLDPIPDGPPTPPPPWRPMPIPLASVLLVDNVRRHVDGLGGVLRSLRRSRAIVQRMVEAWPATHELIAEEPASRTSLDRIVGPGRNLALIRGSADLVRETARTHDATVNDVLLAVTSSGLRALLRARGEPVEDVTVRIYVPVSLRGRLRGQVHGNEISQMVVPLALRDAHPGDRLRRIAAETAVRKARPRTSLGTLFRGRMARRLLLKAVIRQRVNATSASLPGPRHPVYLAGAEVLEVFPILPLIANVSLGIGAMTYAGSFCVGVTADRDTYPDLDAFSTAVRDELRALARDIRRPALEVTPIEPGAALTPAYARAGPTR